MERYRLAELATLSGVTPRTIRYYIAEGVLPPPTGAGPAAAYTTAHRDRLALIELLKGRYLPLRTIATQLATMSDAAVRDELAREATPSSRPPPPVVETGVIRDGPADPAPRSPAREIWERVALADGVELHVRADRLRNPGPLDALVRQARQLFGEG
jgi:DNA-binding transcriptional MerR regulator